MSAGDWPSLRGQCALAERLFGEGGPPRLQAWLDQQLARIDDPAFAQLFSEPMALLGVASRDVAHRIARSKEGSALGGVRFFGGDVARPFVEVIAHDFADAVASSSARRSRCASI